MKKQLLLSIIMLLLPAVASADCEINGIYYLLNDETLTATVWMKSIPYRGDITIPKTVSNGGKTYSVTKIGDSAFKDCTNLTSVTIPDGVTTIHMNAFRGCTSL